MTSESGRGTLFLALTCSEVLQLGLSEGKSPFASSPHCCPSVVAQKEGQQSLALHKSWSALPGGQRYLGLLTPFPEIESKSGPSDTKHLVQQSLCFLSVLCHGLKVSMGQPTLAS